MRGVYTVRHSITSLAAAKTVLLGTNDANTVLEILEASLTNGGTTSLEQIVVGLFRVATIGTPAGTSKTVEPTEKGSAATVVTWLADLTTEPTTYATNPLHALGVTNIAGYYFDPIPEAKRYIAPGASFGLRLMNTPSNAILKAEALITYREVG